MLGKRAGVGALATFLLLAESMSSAIPCRRWTVGFVSSHLPGLSHFRQPTLRHAVVGDLHMAAGGRMAIAGGRGGALSTQLGVRLSQELLAQGGVDTVLVEARLRMAAEAPIVCNVDSIYRDDSLAWQDSSLLGLHAASGMRITSGCPARLIYGVQGGCDACKCVVPALADLKKVCPYYGAKGIVPSVANAWEPSASPKSLLADCSTLLMLSLEDIELQRDAPNLQALIEYQTELSMHARDQGVSELVLVGPSDGIAGGVAEHSRALRRDASVQAALDRHSSQVKGVAADLDSSRAASPSTSSASGGHKAPLRPLAAEEAIRHLGLPLRTIRAPSHRLLDGSVAVDIADLVLRQAAGPQIVVP